MSLASEVHKKERVDNRGTSNKDNEVPQQSK